MKYTWLNGKHPYRDIGNPMYWITEEQSKGEPKVEVWRAWIRNWRWKSNDSTVSHGPFKTRKLATEDAEKQIIQQSSA